MITTIIIVIIIIIIIVVVLLLDASICCAFNCPQLVSTVITYPIALSNCILTQTDMQRSWPSM